MQRKLGLAELPRLPIMLKSIADRHQEFFRFIGLANKIIGAVAQGLFDRMKGGFPAHKHNFNINLLLTNEVQHLATINDRHLQIEQHEVIEILLQSGQRLAAAGGQINLIAVDAQQRLQTFKQRQLIVNKQYPRLFQFIGSQSSGCYRG